MLVCNLILTEKKGSIDEQTCRNVLEEYFEEKFELSSFIKRDTCSCDENFDCNISNEDGINHFIDFYVKETNKTIKL